MPGEVQGCIGCHEPRRQAVAVARPPGTLGDQALELTPPEWGLCGFSYPRIVQPVLDRYCVECHQPPEPPHGLDLTGDKTDFFNVSYEHLAREGGRANPYTKWISTLDGQERNILVITPKAWGSPASKLAEVILSGHPDEQGQPRVKMDPASRQRVLTWIDLNVPYYGTSLSKNHDLPGCRRVYPPELDRVLADVAERRCAACHESKNGRPSIPRKRWVRITNPHLNSLLLAPLAKKAGGTEQCGRAVFANADDPDYQAILKTFEAAKKLLSDLPRADLDEPRG
jgi:mono/diheme cytochrome c family protein